MNASDDPFGILATVIPVFFLVLYLSGRRAHSLVDSLIAGVLIVSEWAALWGVVYGGPGWLLYIAFTGAFLGAGGAGGLALALLSNTRAQEAKRTVLEPLAEHRETHREGIGRSTSDDDE